MKFRFKFVISSGGSLKVKITTFGPGPAESTYDSYYDDGWVFGSICPTTYMLAVCETIVEYRAVPSSFNYHRFHYNGRPVTGGHTDINHFDTARDWEGRTYEFTTQDFGDHWRGGLCRVDHLDTATGGE